MPPRRRRQAEDLRRPNEGGLPDDVDHSRGDKGEEVQAYEPAEEVTQEGKPEDIEPDVLPEERVLYPEGGAVAEQKQALPLAGPGERRKQAEHDGDDQDQKLEGLLCRGHVDGVAPVVHPERRCQPVCQGEVQKEEQEVGNAEKRGRLELGDQADGKDVLIADFSVPEPVRDQAGSPPEKDKKDPQDEGQDEAARNVCRRPDGSDVDHGTNPLFFGALRVFGYLRRTIGDRPGTVKGRGPEGP